MIEAAILVGLAAWRLTSLLGQEAGPFDVFLRFRERLGFQHDEQSKPVSWPENVVALAVACPLCLSVYMVLLCAGLWWLAPAAVWVLAAMTVAVMAERWVRAE